LAIEVCEAPLPAAGERVRLFRHGLLLVLSQLGLFVSCEVQRAWVSKVANGSRETRDIGRPSPSYAVGEDEDESRTSA
jgi:hypothetical protein